MKKSLRATPHASLLHIVVQTVQSSVRRVVDEQPEQLARFAQYCHAVRNPARCLFEAGMWLHPSLQRALQGDSYVSLHRHSRATAIEILYHADPFTLFHGTGDQSSDDDTQPPQAPPPPLVGFFNTEPAELGDGAPCGGQAGHDPCGPAASGGGLHAADKPAGGQRGQLQALQRLEIGIDFSFD